jgi:exosortase/archaeosortase family protein
MDRTVVRLLAWVGIGSSLAAVTATNFVPLLGQQLGDNFGSAFPAVPFAALLAVILALRWRDLREVLLKEGSLTSELPTRLLGLGLVASLLALRGLTGLWVESSGVALVLTLYGAALVVNPLTRRFLLPYAAICSIGVAAPTLLEQGFGEPLAWASTAVSAWMVSLFRLPVAWQGTQFALLSAGGGLVTGDVTPGCSSVMSVTTFLGLLGLMQMDLMRDYASTAKVAVAGVAALFFLNAIRITALIWVGYVGGADALWALHNWLGYALFLGFYMAVLLVYPRMGIAGPSPSGAAKSGVGYLGRTG